MPSIVSASDGNGGTPSIVSASDGNGGTPTVGGTIGGSTIGGAKIGGMPTIVSSSDTGVICAAPPSSLRNSLAGGKPRVINTLGVTRSEPTVHQSPSGSRAAAARPSATRAKNRPISPSGASSSQRAGASTAASDSSVRRGSVSAQSNQPLPATASSNGNTPGGSSATMVSGK